MWLNFANSTILMREVIMTLILQTFDQKNHTFWGVALVQGQLFETGNRYGLVRKCWWLIPTFEEVAGKKLPGVVFLSPLPPFRIGLT